MALHVREQIAVAFLAAVTGLATTGTDVFRDRDTEEQPLQGDELPGLTFDDDGEPAELISIDTGGVQERRMRLRLGAHVKAASGAGALLNQILKEIEVALGTAPLGGAQTVSLAEVSARERSAAGDVVCMRQEFTFECIYYTARGVPDVAL